MINKNSNLHYMKIQNLYLTNCQHLLHTKNLTFLLGDFVPGKGMRNATNISD